MFLGIGVKVDTVTSPGTYPCITKDLVVKEKHLSQSH
jgi:hypothetical protein